MDFTHILVGNGFLFLLEVNMRFGRCEKCTDELSILELEDGDGLCVLCDPKHFKGYTYIKWLKGVKRAYRRERKARTI